jgi:hypothetical protein
MKIMNPNLILNDFKIFEDMGLKLLHRGPLEWHLLPINYHENLQSDSKVISRGLSDRHTDKLVI